VDYRIAHRHGDFDQQPPPPIITDVDFHLLGGWHVTLFHPWAWFAAGLLVLIVCAVLAKLTLAR
jgi:hypothetical protein